MKTIMIRHFAERVTHSPQLLVALLALAAACEGPLPAESPKTQLDQRAEPMPIISDPAPPAPSATAEPPVVEPPLVFKDVGLETPESVLYDAGADLYIVSNIGGKPDARDNNGFISLLNPDGSVKTLKWIAGGVNGVTLNAPKGSAIVSGKLWVSDIDHLRRFDIATGKQEAAIMIKGATFLNDVALGPDGTLYVSDSGVKVGKEGFEGTKSDAIYKLQNNKAVVVAKNAEFGWPNGLAFRGANLLMVTLGGKTLREFDPQGKELRKAELPTGGLDGVVVLGDDDFLISSWQGSIVYRGGFAQGFSATLSDEKSPADFGFDTKRNRLLIPVFLGNEVRAVPLPTAPNAPASATPAAAPTSAATAAPPATTAP